MRAASRGPARCVSGALRARVRRASGVSEALDANENALAPDLQGKVIRTKIVRVDERNGVASAITGVRGSVTYKISELDAAPRVGDVVEARITWMNNPTGTLDLEVSGLARRKSRERGWRERATAREEGKTVRGRILNPVNGGYAIGIAGLIAFCPTRAYRGREPPTTPERAAAQEKATGTRTTAPIVGELLDFKVLKMTSSGEHYRNVVVSGPLGSTASSKRQAVKEKAGRARSWGPNGRVREAGNGSESDVAADDNATEEESSEDEEAKK